KQEYIQIPNQLRWDPFDILEGTDFITGIRLVTGAGEATVKSGLAIYVFSADRDMSAKQAFYSANSDFLIVAQHGALNIRTELGRLLVRPKEIAVIPRGVRFGHSQLPELGPIGSNCLANARDFQIPVADYEDDQSDWVITAKVNGQLFDAAQDHSPFDVVAWHGNYYPHKYDLGRFNTIGSISYDHPDPSIFTVLTAPSCVTGGKGGFQSGGASLHNIMGAYGPDAKTFIKASGAELSPQKAGTNSMAFMFESSLMLGVTEWSHVKRQKV
ncbi:hypothetical protein NW765_017663, partial [Fusarium oxysporum]